MVRDVFLYGVGGRLYGSHFRLDVASPAEAVRALITLRPGLRQLIRRGQWRVVIGPPHLRNAIDVPNLAMHVGSQPIHLVPATKPRGGGRGGKGLIGIIAGVVLIGAAVALTGGLAAAFSTPLVFGMSYGSVVLLGGAMILSGISGLLTQSPESDAATDRARDADRPSFLFNGVTNNSQQGGPVPLVFGTHLTGSIVVGAGLNAEDIASGDGGYGGGGGGSGGGGKWPFA